MLVNFLFRVWVLFGEFIYFECNACKNTFHECDHLVYRCLLSFGFVCFFIYFCFTNIVFAESPEGMCSACFIMYGHLRRIERTEKKNTRKIHVLLLCVCVCVCV